MTSLLLHRVFPEFRCKNTLCVAGCCRRDIAANSRRQNRGEFALCVSRHLGFPKPFPHKFSTYEGLQSCFERGICVGIIQANVYKLGGGNISQKVVNMLIKSQGVMEVKILHSEIL